MATPDRWAPWIEPRLTASADLTVTTAANADVPGVTVTLVPHIDTRLAVTVQVDVLVNTISGGAGASDGILVVELHVNGVASGMIPLRPQVALGRGSYCGAFTVNLTKETSYTIKLVARLNNTVGAPSYTIRLTNTGMVLVGMPNLHS